MRDGGVSGAPNEAPVAAAGLASGGAAAGVAGFGFSTAAGPGASFITDGVNFGENGGVRWRAGEDDWLGGAAGAGRGATGAGRGGAAGAGAGAARGIGGGHAFAGTDAAGVLERDMIGFTPPGVPPRPGADAALAVT